MDDTDVPFVKTISRVTRFPNDSLVEYDTGERMPGFLGAGAEFIPLPGMPFIDGEILDVAALPTGESHVGYVYGGIESTAGNIFFSNTGTQSVASQRLFKVMVDVGGPTSVTAEASPFALQVVPDPSQGRLWIGFNLPSPDSFSLFMTDLQGRVLHEESQSTANSGEHTKVWATDDLAAGVYFVTLYADGRRETVRFRLD